MAGAIDALLFDFGGVFTDSPFHAVHAYGDELGTTAEEVTAVVFGSYEQDSDHPWHQLERGEIDFVTAREGIIEAGRARGMEVDPLELFVRMGEESDGMRQEVVALATRVKAEGYQTAIVTNNAKEFRERWTASVPVAEICHAIVDSSEVGIRKPDRRIYEHALEQLGGIDPSRAVFVDDFPANVAAAEALGMRGVLVEDDFAPALEELERLLR